jgi:transcriptional regulator with XRE-family HTH domain
MNQKRKKIPMTKLRKVRLEKGISLYQVEKDTGYSYSQICKTEIGLANKNNSKHKRFDSRTDLFYEVMAKYYGVSVEDIKPEKKGRV